MELAVTLLPSVLVSVGATVVLLVSRGKRESLEGCADRPVTERLGRTEVVSQHPIVPFK